MGLSVQVEKRLGTGSEKISFMFDLLLSLGERRGIMGESGSGKTTLLRMIAGLLKPDRGIIQWDNEIWYDEHRWLPPHKRRVGLMFQNHVLFPHLTVEANVRYGAAKDCNVQDLLHIGGLWKRRNHYPAHLSGGEQQRVALLRTLAAKPKLLLLDEPFSSLDTETKMQLLSWMRELLRDWRITLLMVSHERSELEWLCEEVCTVEDLHPVLWDCHEMLRVLKDSKEVIHKSSPHEKRGIGSFVWDLPSEKPERLYI